jgi:type I restriction enzyme S subunit
MIADLKPYPTMKDSGVEWLGEVPEHWEVLPGRTSLYEKEEPNTGMVESTVLSLSYGKIIVKPKEKLRGLVPESFETYQVIDPGDVICRPTDLQNDQTSLRFGIARDRGIITSAYMCIRMLPRLDGRYGHLLLHAYDLKKVFYGFGSGLRQNLSWEDFKYLPCVVPPLPEQAAIVRYLDHVDRRVRRLVRVKRKLIALLTEQKQAIIHRAVTRGLDPDVPLKDSGVEWLGEVPEHWEVVRLGKLLRERGETNKAGKVTHVLSLLRDRGVIPYDEKGNIGNKKSDDITRYKVVHPNDIVMNCMNVIIGSVGLASETGCLSPVYYVLTTRGEDHPRYLNAIFQCPRFHRSLIRIGNGILAHRMRIPMELLKCELLPAPPIDEQAAIVEYLDEATADIDTTISRAEREIELLNEYRTRLIADVVTGKLDARDAAAALPEVDPLAEDDNADDLDADLALDADELDEAPEEAEA